MSYCENNVECRRFLLLRHFGEEFDRAQCQFGCDNCANPAAAAQRDVTAEAQAVIRITQHIIQQNQKCKPNVLSEVFRGSKGKAGAPYTGSVTHNPACAYALALCKRVDPGAPLLFAVVCMLLRVQAG